MSVCVFLFSWAVMAHGSNLEVPCTPSLYLENPMIHPEFVLSVVKSVCLFLFSDLPSISWYHCVSDRLSLLPWRSLCCLLSSSSAATRSLLHLLEKNLKTQLQIFNSKLRSKPQKSKNLSGGGRVALCRRLPRRGGHNSIYIKNFKISD